MPQGAEEADGDTVRRVVRDQIGKGADWIKVYADYRWGPGGQAKPTFSIDKLKTIVETAKSANCPVSADSTTAEGMRRAAIAGVATIEHGDDGDAAVFKLMAERHRVCPTLAAGEAYEGYFGDRSRPALRREFSPRRKILRPRSTPASRSSTAAMSASSLTGTTPEN